MADRGAEGLNDSGAESLARVFRGGAVHFSHRESTTPHAHYAWKLHVGLDAPVWLDVGGRRIDAAPVVLVPPNLTHATGAHGTSLAVFIAPGSRGTPWRETIEPAVLQGRAARDVVDLCRRFEPDARGDTAPLVDAIAGRVVPRSTRSVDARVEGALRLLAEEEHSLTALAGKLGLSLDRLSRLVSTQTGLSLRRHAVWTRLMRVLSSTEPHASIAAAAVAAGFSDHAHMTRTYRAYLGRAPSDFAGPPDVVRPW